MKPPVYVTTSWDDGHVLDVRLAAMLEEHGLPGTFYVAPRSVELAERDRLGGDTMRSLAQRFEIGGHTLTHRRLPSLTLHEAAEEIRAGKQEVEDTIGAELRSFCYPGGAYDAAHVELVRDAGFHVGRTVRRYVTALPIDALQLGTTAHAYRHLRDVGPVLRRSKFGPKPFLTRYRDWAELATMLFDRTLAAGGVFHLWGHSWEVDARSDWGRLERVLAHIGRRDDVTYVDNAALAGLAQGSSPKRPCAPEGPAPARRRLVHVVPYYPPHIGGMEKVAQTIAEELAEAEPVEVLTSTTGGRSAPRREHKGDLHVRRLPTLEVAHLPVMPTLLAHLLRVPRRAIVHVHIAQALVPDLVRLAASVRGYRYIAHYHLDVDPSGFFGPVFRAYKRWLLGGALRSAARVIVLSGEQAGFVERVHRVDRDRIVTLPNGVAQEFFEQPRAAGSHAGRFRLLFVGRLSPQKNVQRLLQAVDAVTAPVELMIVGEGDERPMLERMIAERRLGNVRLVGRKSGPELHAWYRWADAFVLPSDKEGMPLVLLEAMAAGLPIVATDVAGVRDTVGGDALLAPPDPGSLAACIDRLAADPQLWCDLSHRSAARAHNFAWTSLVDSLRSLYEDVGA